MLTRSVFGQRTAPALTAATARNAAERDSHRIHYQVEPYERLAKLVDFLSDWHLIPFDVTAADEFERLRKQRVRIGTQDLKIAATTIVHEALLLTANLRDFRQVPGLRAEDWLHP